VASTDGTYDTRERVVSSRGTNQLQKKAVSSYWDTTHSISQDTSNTQTATAVLKPLDKVMTMFGAGIVTMVQGTQVRIVLTDWVLANNQQVFIYALPNSVKLVSRSIPNTIGLSAVESQNVAIAISKP
tara:strand:- start:245 stop:628 length:384 start_codon:yes stop_codon:yes gene_type:complete